MMARETGIPDMKQREIRVNIQQDEKGSDDDDEMMKHY